jgi:Chaperone of endosialidase
MNILVPQFKKLTPICFIVVALGSFAFSPEAQAAPDPPAAGVLNTADGQSALPFVTAGVANSAFGAFSMFSNTTGNNNTAVGAGALDLNNADNNTAVGVAALLLNTTGGGNTAVGQGALFRNTVGADNVAVGDSALFSLSSTVAGNVDNNVAIGAGALANVTEGIFNIAIGFNAGVNLTSGGSNIYIGSDGFPTEIFTIRIGSPQHATFIAGISGTAVVGDTVVVDGNGQLGTVASAARFKKEIRPMDKTSEAILALKPVTFRYKQEIDSKGKPQFGLIAEEVAKVNPDLVVRDRNGEIYSVRYEAVNAMLLNEFLKAHRKIEQQEVIITQLKNELQATAAHQQKQIEALTAGLQKVSAQIRLSKPAPQTVQNNR